MTLRSDLSPRQSISKAAVEMDHQRQQIFASSLQVNEYVTIEWAPAQPENAPWITSHARVEELDQFHHATVRFMLEKDVPPRTMKIPATDDHDVVIKSLQKTTRPITEIPAQIRLYWGNMPKDDAPAYIIYFDGGYRVSRGRRVGVAAAGVYIVTVLTGAVEKLGKYFPVARNSNNVTEWISFVAALRAGRERVQHGNVLIIGDSEIVLNGFNKNTPPEAKHLHDFWQQAKREISSGVCLAHMLRRFGNFADGVCNEVMNNAQCVGNQALFMDAPFVELDAADPIVSVQAVPELEIGARLDEVVSQIRTVEDFAKIRKFRARNVVPHGCESAWAQICEYVFTAIVTKPTAEERDRYMLAALVLPNMFLPTNGSRLQISQHLNSARPFAMRLDRARRADDSAHNDRRSTLSKKIESLMAEFKVRNAVKLMQTQTETENPPAFDFEDVVKKLTEKFPSREAANQLPVENMRCVDPFTAHQVMKRIYKMKRGAATAIDSWTKDLLVTAIHANHAIAERLGTICAWIAMSHGPDQQQKLCKFGPLVMDIIRMARLIGIPKPDGGTRPIVISSFFAKLVGSLILDRSHVTRLHFQYAINTANGAQRIVHRIRDEYEKGKVIIRLDSRNAFNIAQRKRILEALYHHLEKGSICAEMIQFFHTMYQPAAKLVIYGINGEMSFLTTDEGVRQGDALSAFYFCIIMEQFCLELQHLHNNVGLHCFMDDGTIVTDRENAPQVLRDAIRLMTKHGFQVNTQKSSIICKDLLDTTDWLPEVPITQSTEPFKVLGANITKNFAEMDEMLLGRLTRFFDSLDQLAVHPEIKHTILHMCGSPKLVYFCATTPPEHATTVVDFFEQRCTQSFCEMINVDVGDITKERLHAENGADLPDYTKHAAKIFANSQSMALDGCALAPVRLTTLASDEVADSSAEALYDSHWARYVHTNLHEQMEPALYKTALAMRCDVIPRELRIQHNRTRCECGHFCEDGKAIIAHAIKCEQMSSITPATRHTMVKTALRATASKYGISCANEPNFYVYPDTNIKHRPDIAFYVSPVNVVTDITIVSPNHAPGDAAAQAAQQKIEAHTTAASHSGHEFIPFAMETTGHYDSRCFKLFNRLIANVPSSMKRNCGRDLLCATSTALATYRASALRNALREAARHQALGL